MDYASILVETVTGTSYTDTTAVSGKTYYYWVVAKKSSGYVTSSYATGYCGSSSSGGSSSEDAWTPYAENTYTASFKKYCVIDLSAGKNATSYPITYMDSPPSGGFNTDEYKTTKLVLRKIPAGLIKVTASRKINIDIPYYCGIFEVTQKQYKQVTGSASSSFTGDTRPVDAESYNGVRGNSSTYDYPSVDPDTFIGKLQARTGLSIDLPGISQWEYACRAGTVTTYYWGDSMNGSYCWYAANSGGSTHNVGAKSPNAWNLYDMSGNVSEWCIGSYRYGGNYDSTAGSCTSAYHTQQSPGVYYTTSTGSGAVDYGDRVHSFGFRVVIDIPRIQFASGDVTTTSYSGKYDGSSHRIGVTVKSGIPDAVVKYATSINGEFSTTIPTLTDVGSMTVWYAVSAAGYETLTGSKTITITKRSVKLTSGSASKIYDGTALGNHEVSVSGDGFVADEGATYSYTGSQTAVGSSANTFAYTLKANTKAGNYAITTANGTLTVTPSCAVTFDANGGTLESVDGARLVAPNAKIGTPPISTRIGHTFAGWWTSVSEGTQISDSTIVTDDVTFYAHWAANTYNVTFDFQSGSGGTENVIATYGSAMPIISIPMRSGYTFGGYWAGADGNGTQYYSASGSSTHTWDKTGATTVYAKWIANTYAVTFDQQGGSGDSTNVTATYGSVLPPIMVPARTGYTFCGYWTGAEGSGTQCYAADGSSVCVWGNADAAMLYAKWQANRYTVAFDANGGTGDMAPTNFVYDVEYALPSNLFENLGCSFAGWFVVPEGGVEYEDGAIVSNLTSEANGTVQLYANWKANKYTVTFDANGGEGGETVTQDYGTALAAPTVARTGYTFAGWSPAVPSTMSVGNATYVAQWKLNQYTATFDANGGAGGETVTLDYGAALAAPTVARDGYTFNGWSPAVPSVMPAGNVTYVAQWTVNQYTVMFDANGGTGGKSVTLDYGTAFAAPTVTRDGYTFNGWSPAVPSAMPAGNVTCVAQWKINQYTATFDTNGGTGSTTKTQNYGTSLSAPTVMRTGYTFTGWSPSVPSTMPAGNATYVAQWKVNKYTAKFDANGGAGDKTVTLDYGAALAAPTVTREGYTFDGWSPAVPSAMPAGNVTCVAQWKINQYTVTFDANGGAGGKTVTLDYGTTLAAPTVTRTGYTFAGWSPAVPATMPAASATYVAQWTKNQYTVTFDANGGEGGWSKSMDYGAAITTPTVMRTGYTFTGWSPSVPSTMPAGNATYVAQWKINQYKVTFDANGGEGGTSVTRDYGTMLGALPTPTRVGSVFTGWFTSASGGTQIASSTIVSGDATYYAHWTPVSEVEPVWKINSDGVLTGIGDTHGRTDIVIPSSVVRIGPYAFSGCSGLTSVTIPDSVTSIGDLAFSGCSGLTSVTIPDSVTNIGWSAFSGCRGLTSVTMPDSVTNIGWNAFKGCTSLTSVTISQRYCSLSYGLRSAFQERYTSITNVVICDGVTSIEDSVFSGFIGLKGVTIPNSVTNIGDGVFSGCSGLTSVTIPKRVTSIGDGAFFGCAGLDNVAIPESVTSLGDGAFRDCSGLTSMTIPNSVTDIGVGVFWGCSRLTSVTIPDSVTSIGSDAFRDCSGLTSVTIPDSVTSIGSSAFYGCSGLTSVTIPDGVTSIGSSAFYGCSGLKNVNIPNSATNIANTAFSDCAFVDSVTVPQSVLAARLYNVFRSSYKSITSVVICNGATSVPRSAFSRCTSLASLTIPASVTSIASSAFNDCSALTTVYVSPGDSNRVKSLMASSGFDVTRVSFIESGMVRVVFDANGGIGNEASRSVIAGGAVGELPMPTLTGYTFAGWWTAASGGAQITAVTMVTANVTYYAHWTENGGGGGSGGGDTPSPTTFTVTFNANGGEGGKTVTQNYGTALAAPTVTRTGYTFAGWIPAVPSTMPAANTTYTAQWAKNKYTVTFNANGGTGGWSMSMDYGAAIVVPTVTRTGYTFKCWTPAVAATVPVGGAAYTAQWTINRHQVRLVLNGGEGVGSVTVDYGTRVDDLPVPYREGYEFVGWFTAPTGGRRIADNAIVTGDMTLYAQWHTVLLELYELIDGAAPAAASEYNGYLYDEKSGAVKGTIQVKVGKPNAKTGLATIKATVVLGTKKVTLKGVEKGKSVLSSDGPTELALVGGESCEIVLGAEGISGYYGEYVIDGSRNFFTSKDKAEQRAVNDVLAKWLGSFMVIWDGGSLSVSIAAKGKVKVSGTLADGKTKVSASTVLLVGEEWSCVSVTAQKANITFVLWLSHDGKTIEAEGLGDNVHVGLPGTLANGATFQIDADEFVAVFGQTMLPYLPDGVPVAQKGTKWTLPKAGKVVYKNGAPDESKLGDNPCGLKLTYKSKDGTFKGSFKVYAEVKGKPKATTVNVTGFMLNGIGYGTATIKKVGSVPILIE